jgi:hypothetical protein
LRRQGAAVARLPCRPHLRRLSAVARRRRRRRACRGRARCSGHCRVSSSLRTRSPGCVAVPPKERGHECRCEAPVRALRTRIESAGADRLYSVARNSIWTPARIVLRLSGPPLQTPGLSPATLVSNPSSVYAAAFVPSRFGGARPCGAWWCCLSGRVAASVVGALALAAIGSDTTELGPFHGSAEGAATRASVR